MANPQIRIFQSESDQQWYWHVVAENGEIIASGEGYSSKANALRGIANVIEDTAKADIVITGGGK